MGWLGETWAALADLVLPGDCAGCGNAGEGSLCLSCRAELTGLPAHEVRPTPAPDGLPRCFGLGPYDGVLREVLLAYKERARYPLARPLGELLSAAVARAVVASGHPAGTPVLLLPVPDTPAAARARYGDHMLRLARAAAVRLDADGWPAGVATPVTARPRVDSAGLDRAARAEALAGAFAPRPAELARLDHAVRRGAALIALDDILTTGATLTALATTLRTVGVPVDAAGVLAATQRRPSG